MSRKNKIIISVTGIILVLVTLIGLTYAYYLTRINGNTNDKSVTVSLANLELTYSDGNGLIEATNIVPGEVIATKTFSVENTGDKKVINYTVYLDDVINTFENKNDVKLTLTCTSSKGNKCTGTEITYPSTDTLLSINDIEVEEKHNYELKVEFIETNTDQSIDMNKELSGNIIIRDLKGTGSEITNTKGTNSVSVDNAKLLSNYRIYGNSVQETRSGKNLFDLNTFPAPISSIKRKNNGYYISSGNNIRFYTYQALENYIGQTATVSFDLSTSGGGTFDIYAYQNNGIGIKFSKISQEMQANVSKKIIITGQVAEIGTSENYTKGEIIIYNSSYTGSITIDNLQIELGSTATDYEAYGATPSPEIPSKIKSVGDLVTDTNDSNNGKYKISIKTTGKNLFNVIKVISTSEVINNNNGTLSVTTPSTSSAARSNGKLSDYCPNLQVGKTYILSATSTGLGKKIYLGTSKFTWKFDTTRTITEQDLNSPVYFYANDKSGDSSIITISNIQIEEGTSKTEYEPYHEETTDIYLSEPLRQIGDYSDYIDFKSGKVVRNINEYKFTGNENWEKNNYPPSGAYQFTIKKTIFNNITSVAKNTLNTHFTTKNKANGSGIGSYYNLYPSTSLNTTTAAEFVTWLKNNNMILNYAMTTPVEESISLPNIDLNKVKYINIESSTNPSSIELDYVK